MKNFLLVAITMLLLAACATSPPMTDRQKLQLYRAHAGAPVDSFNFLRSFNGWSPVGDAAVAVSVRPGQAYLLELAGACPGLDFARAISVTNRVGRVYAGFDDVIVLDSTLRSFPCRIEQIRPLDVEALERAKADLREHIKAVERGQSAP